MSCNVNIEQSKYIECQWYLICGQNPMDVDCQFCQFYTTIYPIVDSENKLQSYDINKNEGILCHFIHFYENENKLYFFPKDYNKPVTIYLNEFPLQNLCREYLAN